MEGAISYRWVRCIDWRLCRVRGSRMIGELIGLAVVILFMLFCITGVALIVMDKEREGK